MRQARRFQALTTPEGVTITIDGEDITTAVAGFDLGTDETGRAFVQLRLTADAADLDLMAHITADDARTHINRFLDDMDPRELDKRMSNMRRGLAASHSQNVINAMRDILDGKPA